MRWETLSKLIVVFTGDVSQVIMLYTFNLHSAVFQLYLDETKRK